MVKKPATEKLAIPDKAAPLVHPLPNCEPNPKKIPPRSAKIKRRLAVIFGLCSTFNFKRHEKAPDNKSPI